MKKKTLREYLRNRKEQKTVEEIVKDLLKETKPKKKLFKKGEK